LKVFVAGHNGLVGSSLLRSAPKEHQIFVRTRQDLDLRNISEVSKFLEEERIEGLILAAARVGGIASNARYQRTFLVENLQIQNSVITAAADLGVKDFIFLGSSCIYPKLSKQPIPESELLAGPLEPTNEGYALAKIAGIRLVKAIHEEEKLNYFSLMPTNLYGPNDNYSTETSHVPAALLRRFHEAKMNGATTVEVWGTGNPYREFMHVDDLSHACWFLLGKDLGGSIFNVGTGEDIQIKEFAHLVAQVVGYEGRIVFDSTHPDGTSKKLLDVSKINKVGWKSKINLTDGLKQTYVSFLDELERGRVRGY
jgi:GDP-L-fucose synthase